MTQQNFPILDQMTVKPAADGLVAVTVLLAPELVRDYCRFLETLADFFHTVDSKATIELTSHRASTHATFHADGQRRLAEYRARLVTAFDAYTACGLNRKEAVKSVSQPISALSHILGVLSIWSDHNWLPLAMVVELAGLGGCGPDEGLNRRRMTKFVKGAELDGLIWEKFGGLGMSFSITMVSIYDDTTFIVAEKT